MVEKKQQSLHGKLRGSLFLLTGSNHLPGRPGRAESGVTGREIWVMTKHWAWIFRLGGSCHLPGVKESSRQTGAGWKLLFFGRSHGFSHQVSDEMWVLYGLVKVGKNEKVSKKKSTSFQAQRLAFLEKSIRNLEAERPPRWMLLCF